MRTRSTHTSDRNSSTGNVFACVSNLSLLICSSQVSAGWRTSGIVAVTGPWAAVKVEDKSFNMTNWTRGKAASMGGLLCFINLQFCTITSLINIETYLLSVISLVELGTIYKLGPGRVNGNGL